jgi:hypothetical protein
MGLLLGWVWIWSRDPIRGQRELGHDQLTELGPDGFGYATFRLEGGRTFVHVAEWDGECPLPDAPAFRESRAGLGDRCEWGPEVSDAELVGRFGAATRDRRELRSRWPDSSAAASTSRRSS